jgi:hypothetical protein
MASPRWRLFTAVSAYRFRYACRRGRSSRDTAGAGKRPTRRRPDGAGGRDRGVRRGVSRRGTFEEDCKGRQKLTIAVAPLATKSRSFESRIKSLQIR